jgi:hypothetical protein
MTKGDDLRVTARHCRFAAATTSNGPTADILREMAVEYEDEADKADREDDAGANSGPAEG